MPQSAAGWYDVRPETDRETVAVRWHAWHEAVVLPDVEPGTLAIVRETMAAERLSRWTRALELGATDDTPALQWAAREAAAAADSESRRRSAGRRDARPEGGLLDSWISEHAAAQERREIISDRNDTGFFGSGREASSRSWGWLADDVRERERENLLQDQYTRENMERDVMGRSYGVLGHPAELPGWRSHAPERTRGGRPGWR